MPNKKHLVIFSHGFGVRKDDRGLLTDIAQAFPEAEPVLFDYFEINEADKTLTICPFSAQTKMLAQAVEKAKLSNPDAVIDLIAHSQGTMVAALAKPDGIRKVVLLAPVFDMGLERALAKYRSKGADINLDGISKLAPVDGLARLVPAQYWQERKELKPFEEYKALAKKTKVVVIEANQDEVLPKVDLSELDPSIKLISLDGNHGFSGRARKELIGILRNILLLDK
jgi:pimeloyl-ACP methyl ester carboxylesterase